MPERRNVPRWNVARLPSSRSVATVGMAAVRFTPQSGRLAEWQYEKILEIGHPTLAERAREVEVEAIATPEVQGWVDDMIDTMRARQRRRDRRKPDRHLVPSVHGGSRRQQPALSVQATHSPDDPDQPRGRISLRPDVRELRGLPVRSESARGGHAPPGGFRLGATTAMASTDRSMSADTRPARSSTRSTTSTGFCFPIASPIPGRSAAGPHSPPFARGHSRTGSASSWSSGGHDAWRERTPRSSKGARPAKSPSLAEAPGGCAGRRWRVGRMRACITTAIRCACRSQGLEYA